MAKRIVVVGAAGFVGRAVADRLSSTGEVLRLGRAELDLSGAGADRELAGMLRLDDTCIFIAAKAPCKTPAGLADNVAMAANVCRALEASPVAHVVYVSSDAVYADSDLPLTESSTTAPDSLHGAMHLAREIMLRHAAKDRAFALLRPTLIYGASDPHNGYGPNQFRRLAAAGRDITLFGEGEERRDHVFIDDVAEIVAKVVLHRSVGILNVASGATHSFRDIAEQVARLYGNASKVVGSPRRGPMPHGGYRPFDIAAITVAFPGLLMTPLSDGLQQVHKETSGRG